MDTASSDTLTSAAVTSNTIYQSHEPNTSSLYIIELSGDMLDDGFSWVRASIDDCTDKTVSIVYLLHGPRILVPPTRSQIA